MIEVDNKFSFDVDIDVAPDTDKNAYGIRAFIYDPVKKIQRPHPSGYYLTQMPVDAETGMAAIDYKTAEACGHLKVDLLTNTAYARFQSHDELVKARYKAVDWGLLELERVVTELPHIGNHFDIVSKLKPQSIDDLADILALIRPGKLHLIEPYQDNKELVRANLYRRPTNDDMYFKKSHAYAYAAMIITVLNSMDNPRFKRGKGVEF